MPCIYLQAQWHVYLYKKKNVKSPNTHHCSLNIFGLCWECTFTLAYYLDGLRFMFPTWIVHEVVMKRKRTFMLPTEIAAITWCFLCLLNSRASGCPKSISIWKLPQRSDKNNRILRKPKSIDARYSLQSCQGGPDQCPHHTAIPW